MTLPRLLSRNAPSPIFSTVLPSAKVRELMLSQLSNMPSGMSLRPVPIVTEVRSPQSLNASSPTSVSVSGSTNCFSPLAPLVSRLEQPSNALAPIFSSEDGSLTRTSPVQSENARSGISFNESGRLTYVNLVLSSNTPSSSSIIVMSSLKITSVTEVLSRKPSSMSATRLPAMRAGMVNAVSSPS